MYELDSGCGSDHQARYPALARSDGDQLVCAHSVGGSDRSSRLVTTVTRCALQYLIRVEFDSNTSRDTALKNPIVTISDAASGRTHHASVDGLQHECHAVPVAQIRNKR